MEKIIPEIEKMIIKYGIIYALILTLLLVILYYFIQRIKNDAKIPTNKIIEKFKALLKENNEKLLENYKNEIKFVFRDEDLRRNLLQNVISESDKIRLRVYKEVYEVFFDVLYAVGRMDVLESKEEKIMLNDELVQKIIKIRNQIFINSIYLGRLTDYLLNAQIALAGYTNSARLRGEGYRSADESSDKIDYASEQIDNAAKWIHENIFTGHTIKDFDIDSDAMKNIKDKKNDMINKYLENGNKNSK